MRKFILKSTLFTIIILVSFFFVLSLADGHTDGVYTKLTSPKQKSLIVGTSRASQGINPAVINKYCKSNLYNYAFTIGESPYGPVYYKSILKKLDRSSKNQIFIVSIDPWCVSSDKKNINDINRFPDNNRSIATTSNVNLKPNFEYLLDRMKGNYYKIILNKFVSPLYVHDNGWLEISMNMDSVVVNEKVRLKKIDYNNYAKQFRFSSIRLFYLKKIIKLFKQQGKVYLVRLPIHPVVMEIENRYMPDFNKKMKEVIEISDGYIDFTPKNSNYQYHDGNHLYKTSSNIVSLEIANWILAQDKLNID
jgi:hypothetical protein